MPMILIVILIRCFARLYTKWVNFCTPWRPDRNTANKPYHCGSPEHFIRVLSDSTFTLIHSPHKKLKYE